MQRPLPDARPDLPSVLMRLVPTGARDLPEPLYDLPEETLLLKWEKKNGV